MGIEQARRGTRERAATRWHRFTLGFLVVASLAACGHGGSWPEFGFWAYYELPRVRPDDRCGTDNGGPTRWPWLTGPHGRFGELDPRQLALESLRWFEGSLEAAAWRGNTSARLELYYPSHGRAVTARFDRDVGLSWEAQLRTWFACFPPEGGGLVDFGDEHYGWKVHLGGRGTVRGLTASDDEAVREMKALVASLPTSPLFERSSFELTYAVRRSSHVTDCYGVDAAVGAEQIDELPAQVAEKVAHYTRR